MNLKIESQNIYESGALTRAEEKAFAKERQRAFEAVQADELPMAGWRMPAEICNLQEVLQAAKEIRQRFRSFVVLGIGGSALGSLALKGALAPETEGDFFVWDNVDARVISRQLGQLSLRDTCFYVVSKSGSTAETQAQLLLVLGRLRQSGLDEAEHIVVCSEEDSPLIDLAKQRGWRHFSLPKNVGGRFSVLTPVGMLPAAVAGIDVVQLQAGAEAMRLACLDKKNVALDAAVLQYLLYRKGYRTLVTMPYATDLKAFAEWFAQLWGESLGKSRNLEGIVVNEGQTPVSAVGATDQHSQLQLYMEGPKDKVLVFVSVAERSEDLGIPEIAGIESFLSRHTFNELLQSELEGTRTALCRSGRPNYTIVLPRLDAFSIGELIYFWQMQTAYVGAMLHINPFDQPGVEEGKKITCALMGGTKKGSSQTAK